MSYRPIWPVYTIPISAPIQVYPCFILEKILAIPAAYQPYRKIPTVLAYKWIPGRNTILSFFGFTITRELVSKTKLIPKRTLKLKNLKICELNQLRIA